MSRWNWEENQPGKWWFIRGDPARLGLEPWSGSEFALCYTTATKWAMAGDSDAHPCNGLKQGMLACEAELDRVATVEEWLEIVLP